MSQAGSPSSARPIPGCNALGFAAATVSWLGLLAWPDNAGRATALFGVFWLATAPLSYLAATRLLWLTTGRAILMAAVTTVVSFPAALMINRALQISCRRGQSGDYPHPIPAILTILVVAVPLAGLTSPLLRGRLRWLWPVCLVVAAWLGAKLAGWVVGSHGNCDWNI